MDSTAVKVFVGATTAVTGGLLYKRSQDSVGYSSLSAVCNEEYDFIVVGAGVSGCVTARRLAEHHSHPRVLLVEAGPPDNYLSPTQTIPCMVQGNQRTEIDWQNDTEPQKHCGSQLGNRQSRWPSGKVMGGSSILNYMMFVRGHKEDYDSWANQHGCDGWSFDEIKSLWEKIENLKPFTDPMNASTSTEGRGHNGLLSIEQHTPTLNTSHAFIRACQESGFKFNPDYNNGRGLSEGISLTQYSTKHGSRHSAFRSYVAPLFGFFGYPKDGVRIDVLPNSMVTRVLFTDDKCDSKSDLIAMGVEIKNGNELHQIKCDYQNGGEVVVCAGAVYSPSILMRSGVGPKDHLQSVDVPLKLDIPGVGSNLQDHVMVWQRLTVPKTMTILTESAIMKPLPFLQYKLFGSGLWCTSGLDAQLFAHSKAKKEHGLDDKTKYPDLQLVCMMLGMSVGLEAENENQSEFFNINPVPSNGNRYKNGVTPSEAEYSVILVSMLLHPQSRGSIRLKSKDPLVSPVIDPNYLAEQYDVDCAVEGMKILIDIAENSDAFDVKDPQTGQYIHKSKLVVRETDDYDPHTVEGIKKALEQKPMTIYHPAGTCKMGNTEMDEMAVCNARLQVRGCGRM